MAAAVGNRWSGEGARALRMACSSSAAMAAWTSLGGLTLKSAAMARFQRAWSLGPG